jgi:hypothetical protein
MTWEIGLFLNTVICVGSAILVSMSDKIWLKVVSLVLLPYLSAFVLYWGVAYMESVGTPSGEYSSWEGLFVETWAIAGYLGFCIGLIVMKLYATKLRVNS